LVGALLVALLAIAATAGNFFLLRLTQDSTDPVGRLSPRAVFSTPNSPSHTQAPTDTTTVVVTTTVEHHQGADD
jgi:hypothetical protein